MVTTYFKEYSPLTASLYLLLLFLEWGQMAYCALSPVPIEMGGSEYAMGYPFKFTVFSVFIIEESSNIAYIVLNSATFVTGVLSALVLIVWTKSLKEGKHIDEIQTN